ncbi:hypothetical protein Syun_007356 [Stephania yunnanensis]|uniref:Ribosomal protein L18 n=1 Tax=Stephania yunnanensis TaxID=152371 RepID=A0AAP0KZD3_9MAGN
MLRIRVAGFLSKKKYQNFSWVQCLCSDASRDLDNNGKELGIQNAVSGRFSTQPHFSSLLKPTSTQLADFKVEVMGADSWRVSSSLVEAWRGGVDETEKKQCSTSESTEQESVPTLVRDEPDFDYLEDLRIRGNLFYKIDKGSREFEECNFDFHHNKSSKKCKQDPKEKGKSKEKNPREEEKKKKKMNLNSRSKVEVPLKLATKKNSVDEMDDSCAGKRQRIPTFNQLTAPYHEPFCLDIYVSKGSVRASIIHRVTSKVVAVAHSISKDMKFDLSSTKNYTTCVAVGGILAQRALEDDIHDVVYTPRKGEKLEGKLQTILKAIIDNGINVKVKLRKRKVKKVLHSSEGQRHVEKVLSI